MLEQLTQLIQKSGLQSVTNNPDVPNQHNEGILDEAKNAILSVFGKLSASGQTQQVNDALANPDHPAAQEIQQNFASSIAQKFGLSGAAVSGIAASLIPSALAAIKGSSPANAAGGTSSGGFNIHDILQSFAGGNIKDTINNIGGKLGLDKDGDGDVDLDDVTKMFKS
jgi:hypothetical protein